MRAPSSSPITQTETRALLRGLEALPALVLAVSGGPDSVALLVLAGRWRAAIESGPALTAVTVDHGLRPESKAEARAVARLAKSLGIPHRTLKWTGPKPKAGLPQAARLARYTLLAGAARKAGASHILTAHTLDDQAETVVIRLARGSGLTGLAAMQRETPLAGLLASPSVPKRQGRAGGNIALSLLRPLLGVPKARLIATLKAAQIPFAEDPTNVDPAFTRARLRGLMPQLAAEGLDAPRLALLARRLRRADVAIEAAVDRAEAELGSAKSGFAAADFAALPVEIRLRLLGRAIAQSATEGPVELAKLEALAAALDAAEAAGVRYRRTLAGAVVTLARGQIAVEPAPPRGKRARAAANALTKGRRRAPER